VNRWLLAVALLTACDKKPSTPATPPTPPVVAVADAVVVVEILDAAPAAVLPPTSRQLILGIADDWSSTKATLQLFTRTDANNAWTSIGPAWPAVIGRTGTAWGVGAHPPTTAEPTKHEGDGKAPAGAFHLRGAYGYGPAAPAGSKMSYSIADKLECVDDPASKHYASIVDGASTPKDWSSSEQMRATHTQYTWVIDIAHNPDHKPGAGSCIFFHVWGSASTPTDGCTAMPEDKLVALMKQLDPAADPLYVLLPREQYNSLRLVWGLP